MGSNPTGTANLELITSQFVYLYGGDVNEPIPQEWIKKYVDQMLDLAKKLGPGPMQDACLLRADHAMDLVKAFRESGKRT